MKSVFFLSSKIFETGYGNRLNPCSRTENRTFSGLVTSRTTYCCVIYIEIAHMMHRKILFREKKKNIFFVLKSFIEILVEWDAFKRLLQEGK